MFTTNNHGLFHMWCKENLMKHQKVSNYYDSNYSSAFLTYTTHIFLPSLRSATLYKLQLSTVYQ